MNRIDKELNIDCTECGITEAVLNRTFTEFRNKLASSWGTIENGYSFNVGIRSPAISGGISIGPNRGRGFLRQYNLTTVRDLFRYDVTLNQNTTLHGYPDIFNSMGQLVRRSTEDRSTDIFKEVTSYIGPVVPLSHRLLSPGGYSLTSGNGLPGTISRSVGVVVAEPTFSTLSLARYHVYDINSIIRSVCKKASPQIRDSLILVCQILPWPL